MLLKYDKFIIMYIIFETFELKLSICILNNNVIYINKNLKSIYYLNCYIVNCYIISKFNINICKYFSFFYIKI